MFWMHLFENLSSRPNLLAKEKGALVIASLKGKVQVQDRYETKPASVGQVVTSQESILTGADGSAVIIFTNGTSQVGAEPSSFFKIYGSGIRSTKVSQIKKKPA